ncbi:MAG: hypothetical protein J6N70_00500 [Oribacterium sp.]|nr:hypothetical protein [Oribacterium sp.]
MKFFIIPNTEVAAEIEAVNKQDAMATFAAQMDSNMNAYFRAVTQYDLSIIREDRMAREHRAFVKAWMSLCLQDDFDMTEKDADNLATVCYDTYCQGDGLTEYEAVQQTYDETKEEELTALESMAEQYHGAIFGELELCYGPDNIEVREYREDQQCANTVATVSRGCLTSEDVSELAVKHSWYYAEV